MATFNTNTVIYRNYIAKIIRKLIQIVVIYKKKKKRILRIEIRSTRFIQFFFYL